ncbi:MAG: phosphatidate cytidylyltransferase [Frankiales bacterium]|nr:phosphatidate cytidylyltransferase [Frankiales bacterium]
MADDDRDASVREKRPGRHGGSGGGPSVAELIARSRSETQASGGKFTAAAQHHVAAELDQVEVAESITDTPVVRHLTVVDAAVPLTDAPLPETVTSRAGRNLPAAIGVGLALGALILLTIFFYRPSFVVVVALAAALGVYEMVAAISTVEARPPLIPLLVGAVAMDVVAWPRGPDGLVGALLLTVLGTIIWRLGDGAAGYLRDVSASVLVALYVPGLAGFAILLAHPDDGAARVVMFILAVVLSDTGGYAAGVLFGRHPMSRSVSPKKSWEGLAGSLIASAAGATLMMVYCFHQQWWQGVLFGAAIAITATLGDLGESMIKRDLGLKDMGKLLPGHGGIMDRLDSLLPCAPVAYLLLTHFVPK